MQDFVMNAWYMAAWSHEVGENLLSRRLLGYPVLLTRFEDGSPSALLDRCPHRFAPLSRGTKMPDRVVCGYHGLAFDRNGVCVQNPYSSNVPAAARIASFATVERDGIVWIWPGDQAKADPAQVPDFSDTATGPVGTTVDGYTLVKANYEYITDNLLDLSHIEFVHTGTFAGNGVIFAGQHSVRQEGGVIDSDWWMPSVRCPEGFKAILNIDVVDHWLDMKWHAPSSMLLKVGACAPGQPRQNGAQLDQAHILTPATASETHYFWSSNSKYPMPPEQAGYMQHLLREAFDVEDKPMIEAAYANVDKDFWDMTPLSLGIDAGGARARRHIQAMKRSEAVSA